MKTSVAINLIRHRNYKIRRAVDAITPLPCPGNQQAIRMIREEVDRIEWALTEIVPWPPAVRSVPLACSSAVEPSHPVFIFLANVSPRHARLAEGSFARGSQERTFRLVTTAVSRWRIRGDRTQCNGLIVAYCSLFVPPNVGRQSIRLRRIWIACNGLLNRTSARCLVTTASAPALISIFRDLRWRPSQARRRY
jgi:hypothetical protein